MSLQKLGCYLQAARLLFDKASTSLEISPSITTFVKDAFQNHPKNPVVILTSEGSSIGTLIDPELYEVIKKVIDIGMLKLAVQSVVFESGVVALMVSQICMGAGFIAGIAGTHLMWSSKENKSEDRKALEGFLLIGGSILVCSAAYLNYRVMQVLSRHS
jgi:hypothetical protein